VRAKRRRSALESVWSECSAPLHAGILQDASRDLGRAGVDREVDAVADRSVAGTGDLDQLLGGDQLGHTAELLEVLRVHAGMTTEQD